MEIVVNGAPRQIDDGTTIADLLRDLGVVGRLAVEVNGEILARREHAARACARGDVIEIVRAIGGG